MLCNDILLMHKTYRLIILVIFLQLKYLISENMKISKKVKLVGKGGCVHFLGKKHEHIDLLFLLAC